MEEYTALDSSQHHIDILSLVNEVGYRAESCECEFSECVETCRQPALVAAGAVFLLI